MSIGTSLFLIAVGAILKYAVTGSVSGIDVPTVGVILMIVGVIGLLFSILWLTVLNRGPRREEPVVREREYR